MKFSQRIGLTPVKVNMQIESMDSDLRVSLWNVLQLEYFDKRNTDILHSSNFKLIVNLLWHVYFKSPLDTMPSSFYKFYDKMRKYLFSCQWYEFYDFVEFIISNDIPPGVNKERLCELLNVTLETEMSGYRIIDSRIVPITGKAEVDEIEEAINDADSNKYKGVAIHLKTALEKLSDRKRPDYRNSIKESISAVESLAIIISGDRKSDIDKALKVLKGKIGLHPALQKAFNALYGYTSDSDGIRHAILDCPSIDFEDAKYMLVVCSAFVNYLISKLK